MRREILVLMTFACLLSSIAMSQDVASVLEDVQLDRPRLLMEDGDDVALRQKVKANPVLTKAAKYITETADATMTLEPVQRKKTGRRLLGVSRTCLKRVLYLATAYRLTGEKRYAVRAQEEMLAAAEFKDWNPSHFLDVAEMTAALALGYDWLYAELDPEAREKIKNAIIEKGLQTSIKGGWWVNTTNNWNQVCHGGLILGALAVLDDEPELAAQIIKRAVQNLPKAMNEYAPDGAYPEGPGYWVYGTTYNVILLSALESVLGTDFGLMDSEGFLESSDYFLHVAGPTGLFFNYSDCGARSGVSPAMYWFAAKREKPSILWREHQKLEDFLEQSHHPQGGSNRFFPLLVLWSKSVGKISPPEVTDWKAEGKTPVGIHRSSWQDPEALFVAVKGGSPGTNHAHMDIGSFVMDAGGVRWAWDLGAQSYNDLESQGVQLWDKEQDGQRWNVFRLNNFSHNTLVVDGKKQQVAGFAPIISFSDKEPMPHTVVDMTSVYKGQLARAKRGVGLLEGKMVVIQDEVETLDRQTSVRWGMVTKADIDIKDRATAELRSNNRKILLKVIEPADVKLETFETANPPRKFDEPNKGTEMIGFKIDLPSATTTRFVVILQPENGRIDADISPLSSAVR